MSEKYTWSWDGISGCATIFRQGEQILRTMLPWDEQERHEKLAKLICAKLHQEESGKRPATGPGDGVLSESDITVFEDIITRGLASDNTNQWERTFLNDYRGKIRQYGITTKVSAKQREMFFKIEDVIVNGRSKR